MFTAQRNPRLVVSVIRHLFCPSALQLPDHELPRSCAGTYDLGSRMPWSPVITDDGAGSEVLVLDLNHSVAWEYYVYALRG
jgi:hypothetical protein